MADNTQTPSNHPDLDKGKLASLVTPPVAPQPEQPVKIAPPTTAAPANKS